MEVITYSLRDGQERSDRYYQDIAAFADEVIAEGKRRLGMLVETFQSFLEESDRESPRTQPEYLYEFLVLGVLWRVYAGDAVGLAEMPRQVLTRLASLRERDDWLKSGVDVLRGVLGTLFLSPARHGSVNSPGLTLDRLVKLLGWLTATGNFGEEVKRLTYWRDFLATQSPGQIADHLAAAVDFATWFEIRSAHALGRYTRNVERFLAETHPTYRWREDALFCGRTRVEYHLNMVGTEILNRAFRETFLHTRRKAVLVPPCMRFQSEDYCQARPTALGAQCAGCTPGCRVHQVTKLGEKYGFLVFILPRELSALSARPGRSMSDGDLGVVGVSCVLTNAAGGWETKELGIPAQGLLLDYCGCRFHWHPKGIPTDINFPQLLRVLGITGDERLKS